MKSNILLLVLVAAILLVSGCTQTTIGQGSQSNGNDLVIGSGGEQSGIPGDNEENGADPGENGDHMNNGSMSNGSMDDGTPDDAPVEFSLTEISRHTTPEDCWMAINGKVYDVTAFIASGNHGGGDAILQGCGLDATELYETRPMGSGTPHSEFAVGLLENYYIGNLAQDA